MYLPEYYALKDRRTQIEFIRKIGWGLLTGIIDDAPFVTHLPFLVAGARGEEKLVAHMARANPHWESFADGKPQLVVFSGPHTYISPSWHSSEKVVPTWNYAAAHVYGTPVIVGNPATVYAAQQDLVQHYEEKFDKPWRMEDADANFIKGMLGAIVSFEIPIERIQCKFKMTQNRPAEDRRSVIYALETSTNSSDNAVARFEKEYFPESNE
ncbi:MAG: Protease synthase and sporulation protein PAI 2 [Alphaproteobacteria bacterium MarineAlpha4_Bin2]|nr:MAG: Protease synthase and sporulation protein PAI 2 [Alphaproteobacteria bacterium MarineAlpha4_Bin2]